MTPACVIGVRGYSGAGKTTLIERALPALTRLGLSVAVIKHTNHHRMSVDTRDKDTDRFFRAGAACVFAHDGRQAFSRCPAADEGLEDALQRLPRGIDLVIVEGYKETDIPAIRLEHGRSGPSRTASQPSLPVIYRESPDCLAHFMRFVRRQLKQSLGLRPVRAGILIGGRSGRMGRPKGLLSVNGRTLMERAATALSGVSRQIVFLGTAAVPDSLGPLPRLPDVPDIRGPLAGILSAFAWSPGSAWLISAVDLPFMSERAWQWLLRQRRPGVWAVMPRLRGSSRSEPAAALYEPMLFDYVAALGRRGVTALQAISDHPKVSTPVIPASLAGAWRNVNTVEEWRVASAMLRETERRSMGPHSGLQNR